jgi:hypothetical protein
VQGLDFRVHPGKDHPLLTRRLGKGLLLRTVMSIVAKLVTLETLVTLFVRFLII